MDRRAATSGGTTSFPAPRRSSRRSNRRQRALHDHLHLRHHRPAEGRGPRPRRVPDQGRPRPGLLLRPATRRHPLLADRSRLDDGSLADLRRADRRRDAHALRGHARLSEPGPALAAGRGSPGHRPRRRADGHPRADGQGRRIGCATATAPRCACSARPARPGTPAPGAGTSTRSARGAARSSTTRAGRRPAAASSAASRCARSCPAGSTPRCRGWTPTWSTTTGNPVRGEVGELVVRQPWVGMTRGFWHDPERYLETYWCRIPGVWVHGDWAEIDDGRPLVHPRPLGRHAESGRQAGRPGRSRIGGDRAPRRAGGGRDRRAARGQGRGGRRLRRAEPGSRGERRAGRRGAADDRRAARRGAAAAAGALRARPAEDAQRQDHAPGDPRRLPGAAARRRDRAGECECC